MVRLGDRTTLGVAFETVLHAARSNTPWACTLLWREYAPAVAGFARAKGSREPDDITSEVFLAAFAQLATFEGDEADFRSFLFTIAFRRVTDELRQRSRRGESVEWSDDEDPRLSASAEDIAAQHLGDDEAVAIINSLPDDQRTVMILRVIADLTIDQIAHVTGKRIGAVKALQRRALENLRKRISPDPYPSERLAR